MIANHIAMSHQITTILFDADGVLQYPSIDYRLEISKFLGPRKDEAGRFLSDLFVVERDSLVGISDFQEDLKGLLNHWNLTQHFSDILNITRQIKPSIPILTLIGKLRSFGILCCIASNQQAHRAHFMSNELGYSKYFDKEFYSCNLGFVKPDLNFFQSIIDDIGGHPNNMLFIDDQESNVVAARTTGINSEVFSSASDNSEQALMKIITAHTHLNHYF